MPTTATKKVAPTKRQAARITKRRPRKERLGMAAIRAMYTFILPGFVFALEWLVDIDKLIGWGLAVPLALAIGAGLYGLKRYLSPDGKW